MKYLIISENVEFLEDILSFLTIKAIQKIKFYTSEIIDKTKFSNIQEKMTLKNISIEIVQTSEKNAKYENEETIDKEDEKYYEMQNKIPPITKKLIIQNKNWFNSFNSEILNNLGIDYIKRILDLFSKIYPKTKMQPNHFSLLNRYKISKGKKVDKNDEETILKPYEKLNNLLILIDSQNEEKEYYGFFKVEYFHNRKGVIFSDKGNNNNSYEIVDRLRFIVKLREESICLFNSYGGYDGKEREGKCIEIFEIKKSY